MTNEIPNIVFESNNSKVKGLEIITIESLVQRKDSLNHYPEKVHQLNFYILVFYTKGETGHFVDFVWHKAQKNDLFYLSKGQVNAFQFNESLGGYVILFTEDYFKTQLNKLPKNAIVHLFNSHLFSPKIHVPEDSNISNYMHLLFDEFYKNKDEFNQKNILDALYNIYFFKIRTV